MVKLSQRLTHLADMVQEGAILADVGTDHGYLPIYLLLTGKIQRAFAMDIRKGPLLRAKEHTKAYGLGDYITLRISDGVKALAPKEADSILIAGMGGGVMLHILQEGEDVIRAAKELILQPQSEIRKVREYLYQNGYIIDREDMVLEEGKYYPMMHVVMEGEKSLQYTQEEWQMVYRFGDRTLHCGRKALDSYLCFQKKQCQAILSGLALRQGEAALARKAEVEQELYYINAALQS